MPLTKEGGNFVAKQKSRNLVMVSNEETIKDLKYIQEMILCNKGIKVGLQQVVNHIIHHYLKER